MSRRQARDAGSPGLVLAWATLLLWTALLALTDWLFATCNSDCSDSGGLQGMLLLAVLAPAVAIGAWYLGRSAQGQRSRRALAALAVVCTALMAYLVLIFVGV